MKINIPLPQETNSMGSTYYKGEAHWKEVNYCIKIVMADNPGC